MMKTSDFYYDLPEGLIAQTPIEPRDHSRLMLLNREKKTISDHRFYELPEFLLPGDLLVVNDSKVLPARLYGERASTGAKVEILLLEQKENDVWEVLTRPGKKAKIGDRIIFGEGKLTGEVVDVLEEGNRLMRFTYEGTSIYPILEEIGQMPLPHYIKAPLENQERYQTIYADEVGSAAAPTAGLHFTKDLMNQLKEKGVKIATVTLHVGLGTFRPVKAEKIEEHHMHSEHYELSERTAEQIRKTKAAGGRVIAVGTTSCRTLESVAKKYDGKIQSDEGYTDIFIYPGKEFRVLDGLITNFHLPESTLVMLVSAFAGYDFTMEAYHKAVEEKYRFFSFGDAMLIL